MRLARARPRLVIPPPAQILGDRDRLRAGQDTTGDVGVEPAQQGAQLGARIRGHGDGLAGGL
jgi:hypothetical protein